MHYSVKLRTNGLPVPVSPGRVGSYRKLFHRLEDYKIRRLKDYKIKRLEDYKIIRFKDLKVVELSERKRIRRGEPLRREKIRKAKR